MAFDRLATVRTQCLHRQRRSRLFALDGITRPVPGYVAACQREGTIPLFLQERRHTGACKFIASSTVSDDSFVARQFTKPVSDFIRWNANGSLNDPGHAWPYVRSDNIQDQCLAHINHGLCLGHFNPWSYNSYLAHSEFRI